MTANTYHQERVEIPPPPSGCPLHRTWSPLNTEYLADPYPIAADLRAEHRVFYTPSLNCLVVTDMADIEAVFSDHETFASTNVVIEILARRLPSLELVEGQEIDYFPNITFRGPTELHVTWT